MGEHLSPAGILSLAYGYRASKALLSATELGVFTELAKGPLDARGLTERLGLHPRGTRDFFDALVAGRHGNERMWLCEIDAMLGKHEQALQELEDILVLGEQSGEGFPVAECYRLKGELLLRLDADHQAQAETCFHQALDLARAQQAKSWELRAAMSLARLWQHQDKRQDASDLLAPVYEWFTEGFDTADLQDAKALLEEISENR